MPRNNWIRSQVVRQPAQPGKPVIDPAEWYGAELADSDHWIYTLAEAEIAEVAAAVAGVEERGFDIKDITRRDFPLPNFAAALDLVHDELMDGRGFAVIRGLPVAGMTRAQAAAAFWGIGTYLGEAISQNAKGHVLGHVKDLGGDYSKVRGYHTHAHMAFHSDQCDILALGCLHTAKSGGASRICSSVALHNEMLRRRPELAKELGWKFYRSRQNDVVAGEAPWHRQGIFNYHQGYFAARGVSANLAKAQKLPGVPKFTPAQVEALDMFKALAGELAMDIDIRQGDLIFVMNHVILHSRTEFEDWPEPERKRHLLRLWLTTHGERPLPDEFLAQEAGVRLDGVDLTAPLDAE
jgi:hypothetical protein